MRFKRTLIAGAVALATATAASAADIPMAPMAPAPAAAPVAAPAPAFSWTGAYWGPTMSFNFAGPPFYGYGFVGGYDFQANRIVFGARTFLTSQQPYGTPFAGLISGELNGRVGFLFASERLLGYGNVGIGWGGAPFLTFGIGAEFAISDTFHVFAEVDQSNILGGPPIARGVRVGVTLR